MERKTPNQITNTMNTPTMTKEMDAELQKMLAEDPTHLMMWMLVKMGEVVIETNAGSMILKQESTLNKQRYEIKAKITAKKIKPPKQ